MIKVTGLLSFILLAGLGHAQNKKSTVKPEVVQAKKDNITSNFKGKNLIVGNLGERSRTTVVPVWNHAYLMCGRCKAQYQSQKNYTGM